MKFENNNINNINMINLTPHDIKILDKNKKNSVTKVIPPANKVLRVPRRVEKISNIFETVYDDIRHIDMPPIIPKTIYIVSGQTASALHKITNRPDIFFPTELIKEPDGKVIGCRSLGTFSHPNVVKNFLSIPIIRSEDIIKLHGTFYLVEEYFSIKHSKKYTTFGYFIREKSQILNLHSSKKNITALRILSSMELNNIDYLNKLYQTKKMGIIVLNDDKFIAVKTLSNKGNSFITDNATFKALLPFDNNMQKTISVYLQKLQTRYFTAYALAQ